MVRPSPAPVPGSMADRTPRYTGPAPVSEEEVWALLSRIPDPEIPVITITDLGIVRTVIFNGGTVNVAITPTYSGCPATSAIAMAVETTLLDAGLTPTVTTRIDPPWTTDWIGPEAREKLRAYGIAPPSPSGGPDACPHCGDTDVTRVSAFGSTPCKAQWRCNACLEPFDYFKCH